MKQTTRSKYLVTVRDFVDIPFQVKYRTFIKIPKKIYMKKIFIPVKHPKRVCYGKGKFFNYQHRIFDILF